MKVCARSSASTRWRGNAQPAPSSRSSSSNGPRRHKPLVAATAEGVVLARVEVADTDRELAAEIIQEHSGDVGARGWLRSGQGFMNRNGPAVFESDFLPPVFRFAQFIE